MSVQETSTLSNAQVCQLETMFADTYWAADRTVAGIEEMLNESDLVVALEESDTETLVAFARVLTDFTYRAFVEDVLVARPFRGEDYGRELVERVIEHPDLSAVDSFTLGCETDLVPFYEQFGFERLAEGMAVLNLER